MEEKKNADVASSYFEACRQALKDPDCPGQAFLKSIGLSPETAIRAGLGYDPAWPGEEEEDACECLVIPLNDVHYQVYRLKRTDGEPAPEKVWLFRGSQTTVWNGPALLKPEGAVLVSGVFDALAVIECGWPAVAVLGNDGDTNVCQYLTEVGKPAPDGAPFVVAMGDIPLEHKTRRKLDKRLRLRGAGNVVQENLVGEEKRVYEAYCKDPEAFREALAKAAEEAGLGPANPEKALEDVYIPEGTVPFPKDDPLATTEEDRPRVKTEQRATLKAAREMTLEPDEDLRKRIEAVGVSLDTIVKAALGIMTDGDDLYLAVPFGVGGKSGLKRIPWGVQETEIKETIGSDIWPSMEANKKGTIFLVDSIPDALVVQEAGARAIALSGGSPEQDLKSLQLHGWLPKGKRAVVVAFGGARQEEAGELVALLKKEGALAAKAKVAGDAPSILDEYRRNPDLVRRRIDLCIQKCDAAIKSRAPKKPPKNPKNKKGKPKKPGNPKARPAQQA